MLGVVSRPQSARAVANATRDHGHQPRPSTCVSTAQHCRKTRGTSTPWSMSAIAAPCTASGMDAATSTGPVRTDTPGPEPDQQQRREPGGDAGQAGHRRTVPRTDSVPARWTARADGARTPAGTPAGRSRSGAGRRRGAGRRGFRRSRLAARAGEARSRGRARRPAAGQGSAAGAACLASRSASAPERPLGQPAVGLFGEGFGAVAPGRVPLAESQLGPPVGLPHEPQEQAAQGPGIPPRGRWPRAVRPLRGSLPNRSRGPAHRRAWPARGRARTAPSSRAWCATAGPGSPSRAASRACRRRESGRRRAPCRPTRRARRSSSGRRSPSPTRRSVQGPTSRSPARASKRSPRPLAAVSRPAKPKTKPSAATGRAGHGGVEVPFVHAQLGLDEDRAGVAGLAQEAGRLGVAADGRVGARADSPPEPPLQPPPATTQDGQVVPGEEGEPGSGREAAAAPHDLLQQQAELLAIGDDRVRPGLPQARVDGPEDVAPPMPTAGGGQRRHPESLLGHRLGPGGLGLPEPTAVPRARHDEMDVHGEAPGQFPPAAPHLGLDQRMAVNGETQGLGHRRSSSAMRSQVPRRWPRVCSARQRRRPAAAMRARAGSSSR